jgi:hypothetical protein
MANVFREHDTQVPLVEDQHTVSEFGSQGAHEPFGKTVRPRATAKVVEESGPRGCPHRPGRHHMML